jgi:hypothetical protein
MQWRIEGAIFGRDLALNRTGLSRSARVRIASLSLATLLLVSYIDWLTGDESLFFVFYFVPVALFAWYFDRFATLSMAALCGVSWFAIDRLSGHPYSHPLLGYWNAFICFLAFAILGAVLNRLRHTMQAHLKARQDLARALEEVTRSNEEVRKLQSELQVLCAWTNRIKVDGNWIPLDKFLTNKLNVQFTHGISPEAFENLKKLK